MLARLSNILAVTKPIVCNTAKQVQSRVWVTTALEHTHAIRWLQEEQDYWVKEWEVALVCGTSIVRYVHTNHV